MGKKTLEEIGKILLVSFISIMLTSIGVRRTLLDTKLDKEEYKEDQARRWDSHDKIQAKNDERNAETYRMVKFLYEREINKKD